jgi:hypothetical protein
LEQPLMTLVVCVKPGATFTIPETSNHAAIRSRSPRERLRLLRIDSVVRVS